MTQDAIALALSDAGPEVRLEAIREVAEDPTIALSEPALDALVASVGANRKVIQRRAAEALAGLAWHDARVIEKLRAALSNADSRARWGAAYALGLVTLEGALDLAAMPALIEAISSSDGDVRWAAAELIVRLGKSHRDAVSMRLIELARDGNLNARKMALYCLRDVGGPREELLAVAESCSGDHQSLLKMAALSLIPRIENPGARATNLALHLLEDDPDAGVRRCAAVALGHLANRSPRVTEALARAAHAADDLSMQRAAQGALVRLGVNA
jgi:HEAT repeat protein